MTIKKTCCSIEQCILDAFAEKAVFSCNRCPINTGVEKMCYI
jgi:hypothetical protein